MIAVLGLTLATGLVVASTALGRRPSGYRPTMPEPQPAEPVHSGAQDDPETTAWLRRLHTEPPPPPAVPPAEGSDEWWAGEFKRIRRVLDDATAEFGRRLYAAVGPELLIAEQEFAQSEFWAIVTAPNPEFEVLDALSTPTGEFPVVDGYQRAELVF